MTRSTVFAVLAALAVAAVLVSNKLAIDELRQHVVALGGEVHAINNQPSCGDVVTAFNVHYYEKGSFNGMTYLGVPTMQNPPDMWAIQEIITEVRPDYIIEAGTLRGGSALYMATMLEALGLDGKVLTIDIKPQTEQAEKIDLWKRRIELFTSSSTEPGLVAKLAERVKGKKVLVMLDSNHTRDHVFNELEAYGPMISPGSYMIVQDTNVNGHPVYPSHGPGPWEAVHDWLPKHPEFQIDKSREKFEVTFTPEGYLKRSAT